ncbi:MAG: hypothetical protein GYB31_20375 [Bacteroidetes bacterium]|nr:hypothetical protein [Bacteroidota bacterium]
MRKQRLLLWLAVSLLGISACKHFNELEDIETVGGDAEFAVPLINTTFSFQGLLENLDDYTFIEVDPDGLIHLRYKGDVLTRSSDDIFASIAAAAGAFVVEGPEWPIPLENAEGVEIDYVEVKTGTLAYSFGNAEPDPVAVTVTFPQMTDENGEVVQRQHLISGASPGDTTMLIPQFIDMANYTLAAAPDGNIYIEYEAINTVTSDEVILPQFVVVLSNLTFSYAEGYFANQLHDAGRDTIEIEFFENWTRGDVYFENPTITIEVQNSFGVPTRSIAEVFDIITVDGDVLTLESAFLDTGIDFEYPTLDEVGETKVTYFTFDTTNSNIAEVLGSQPVAVDYDVDAITNPDNDTDIRGFIVDGSKYQVLVEVDLPIYGNASGFGVVDTFDLSFDGFDKVEAAEFKLITENNLPLNVGIQAYFVDQDGVVLDSLLEQETKLIDAAPVDDEGVVTQTNTQTFYIPFDAERFDKVRTAERVLLAASFSTYLDGDVSVKVFDKDDITVKMGMRLETSGD